MLRAFEEDEAHAIGAGIEPARIEQLEVEAAQPRASRSRSAAAFSPSAIFDQAQAPARARSRRERFGVRADEARDEDLAGDLLVDASRYWPGARPRRCSLHHLENARPLGLPQAQIFVAPRRQAVQMAEQPVPDARIAAVAFPDNGDGGHGPKSPRQRVEPRRCGTLPRATRRRRKRCP